MECSGSEHSDGEETDGSGLAVGQERMGSLLGSAGSITSLSESVLGNKRLYSEVATGSGTDTEVGVPRAQSVAKRGKARGASHLTRARAEARRSQEEDAEASFSASLGARAFRRGGPLNGGDDDVVVAPIDARDFGAMGADGLMATAMERLGIITSLVGKTAALKGGFSSKIMRASSDIRDIVDTLVARSESDEVRRLKADNGRLQREVAIMKAEVAALRRGFEEARREAAQAARTVQRQAAPVEDELEQRMARLIDGRLAALGLAGCPRSATRPPLAGDNSEVARAARTAIEEASGLGPAPRPEQPVELEVRAPARPASERRGCKGVGAGGVTEWGPFGPSTSTAVVDECPELPWVEVRGRRGKGKGVGKKSQPKPAERPAAAPTKATATAPKAPPRAAPARAAKLSAPSSSAVILKLQPEAAQKGATYSSALLKAEQAVSLEGLGIGSLRIRPSATGARLIEVSGPSNSDKADALASALKAALSGVADVSRPVKTADFRVTGLNDAATAQRIG
nr:translation initiation factor IF-2-like [Plodia interpunctella]